METAVGVVTGTGLVALNAPYNYSADVSIDGINLKSLGELTATLTATQQPDVDSPAEASPGPGVLPIALEGLANLATQVQGTFSPWELEAKGRGESASITVDAREITSLIKPTLLEAASFRFGYNKNGLTLSDVKANTAGGTIAASLNMPLADEATGNIALQLTAVHLQTVIALPAGLAGDGSVDVKATFGPQQETGQRPLSVEATASLTKLLVRQVPVGDAKARFTLKEGLATYDLTGSALNGSLAAKGTWPVAAPATTGAGELTLLNADLSKFSLIGGASVPRIGGKLIAEIKYTKAETVTASGFIEVNDVRANGELITERLRGRLIYDKTSLRFANEGGSFAGGALNLGLQVDPSDFSQGTIDFQLRRVDVAKVAALVPGAEGQATGTLNLRLKSSLRNPYRWQGSAELMRGNVAGLTVSEWRVPLDIDASPNIGKVVIKMQRTTLRAVGGRGTASFTVEQGFATQLNADISFTNLAASDVLGSFANQIPGGRITGTAKLSSRNFRGLGDLEGSIRADIRGGQAGNLPVVGSAVDLIKLPIGGGNIDKGEFRADLRGGLARIERFSLVGKAFRFYAEGTIALSSERLALDVVVDTSPARQDRLLAGILLRQAVLYATPYGWIERANRFIAERALYLRITGTIRRPIVQVRAQEQLQQEAVRFFLDELAAPVPGGVPAP